MPTAVKLLTGSFFFLALVLFAKIASGANVADQAEITGTVGDQSMSWIIRSDAALPTAVFSTLSPGSHIVRITGYRDSSFAREQSLSVELLIVNDEVSSATVRYFPFPPLHPRFSYGEDHGSGSITLEAFGPEARTARIAFQFSGELYYHQSPNTQPIAQRTVPVKLSADLTALRD